MASPQRSSDPVTSEIPSTILTSPTNERIHGRWCSPSTTSSPQPVENLVLTLPKQKRTLRSRPQLLAACSQCFFPRPAKVRGSRRTTSLERQMQPTTPKRSERGGYHPEMQLVHADLQSCNKS